MEELTHAHRKILRFLKKGQYTVEELAELTFFSQQTIRGRMAEMKRLGYAIEAIKSDGENKKYYIPAKPLEKQTSVLRHTGSTHYRIALLSDTHLGAETEDLDSLHKFYQIAKEKGVREFFHSGDMCVLPNTLILTRKGLKEISKIGVGDEVLTHKNRWKKVVNIYKRNIKENIIEIHDDVSDYPTLSLTKNHPVWTSNCLFRYIANRNVCFKEAGKLTLNNTIIGLIEKEQFKEKKQIQLRKQSVYDKIKSSNLEIISIDDDFLTIIGLFLGDGSVKLNKKRGSVHFYLEKLGKKRIAHEIIKRWCKKNNICLKFYKRNNVVIFYIHYKPLAEFFDMFYDEKRNKTLPTEWLNIPLFQFKKIIYGFVLSDGVYGHTIRICNTAIDLLKKIKIRLCFDGIFVTLNISRKKGIGKIMSKYCNQKPYYELGFCNASCKEVFELFGRKPRRTGSRKVRTSFFYTLQRIEKIKKKNYKGDVFNLGVEDDNSYIANGIIVHNCDGTGVYPGQIAGLKVFTGMKQVEYAAANYPELQGCKSYFICGNHDLKLMEREDIDIGPMIAARRPDMIYLGQYEANIYFEKASLRLIHPDGGMPYAMCFDDKTEILTENGWKLFKDLNKEEKVATLNKAGFLEYQKPINYTNEFYNGKMYHFKAKTFDLLVTPNHNMYLREYPKGIKRKDNLKYPTKSHRRLNLKWKLVEAQQLTNCRRQQYQMKKDCIWEGWDIDFFRIPHIEERKYASHPMRHLGEIRMKPFLEFLGWFISEGNTSNKATIKIDQSIKNRSNRERIIDSIKRIGLKPGVYGKAICCYSRELKLYLDDNCGKGAYNKKVPKFIKELSPKLIEIFLNALIDGDGWRNKKKQMVGYTSYSNILLDDIQELLIKCGYSSTINKKNMSLTIYKTQITPTINKPPKVTNYKGRVYCVEVSDHIIMVRRNGRNIWSGNSYRLQKYVENISGGTKPNIISMGHLHQSLYAEIRNIHCFLPGSFQRQNNFLRRKGVDPQISAWIIDFNLVNKNVDGVKITEVNNLKTEKIRFY